MFSLPSTKSIDATANVSKKESDDLEEIIHSLKKFRSESLDTSLKRSNDGLKTALKAMKSLSDLRNKVEKMVDRGHQELAALLMVRGKVPEELAKEYCWAVDWERLQKAMDGLQMRLEEANMHAYEQRRVADASKCSA